MRCQNVPQGRIAMGSNEIEEAKEYVYFGRMLNIHRHLDAEIPGWKSLTRIKDVFKTKPDKTLPAKRFNSNVLPEMLSASETWATMKKEEQ